MIGGEQIEVLLLGAAQDGGFPTFGCVCVNCMSCYNNITSPDAPTSLALLDHALEKWWLVDATPQLNQQWAENAQILSKFELSGIILTHAHAGHYPGLLYLGKECQSSTQLPVYASPSMHAFLQANEPWAVLYKNSNLTAFELLDQVPLVLSESLTIIPQKVDHRADFTDTFSFKVQGTNKTLFFCPDIDSWEGLPETLATVASSMDILLLDATFFDDNELPSRDMSLIPHPRVVQTVEILKSVDFSCEVVLVHMNHSNKLWLDSELVEQLETDGITVGRKGMKWMI